MTPYRMAERGIEVHVPPATASLDDIRAVAPDGLFYSNGPGDPAATTHQVEVLRGSPGLPYFRICFGNQLFGRALGFGTYKAQVRPPRHQPTGDGPHDRQDRGDRPQPRVRRRRAARGQHPPRRTARPASAMSASMTTSSRARAARPGVGGADGCWASRCSTTPRQLPDRTTRRTSSTGSSSSPRREIDAQARRHHERRW